MIFAPAHWRETQKNAALRGRLGHGHGGELVSVRGFVRFLLGRSALRIKGLAAS